MAQTNNAFGVDGLIAYRDNYDGGSFYDRDKYMHLGEAEWLALFSIDFDNLQHRLPLLENGCIFVDVSCDILTIQHWYFCNGKYSPTRMGIKIRKNQWDAIRGWLISRGEIKTV